MRVLARIRLRIGRVQLNYIGGGVDELLVGTGRGRRLPRDCSYGFLPTNGVCERTRVRRVVRLGIGWFLGSCNGRRRRVIG